MKRIVFLSLAVLLLAACHRPEVIFDNTPRVTQAPDFIYLEDSHFALNGAEWFPIMLNYKADWRRIDDTVCLSPAFYYDDPDRWEHNTSQGTCSQLLGHFRTIAAMGFNCVRICIDVANSNEHGYFYGSADSPIYLVADSSAIFQALTQVLQSCAQSGLRAMLLLKAPLDPELEAFAQGLMRHFADNPTLFAYDLMNEPLYFDPAERREKAEAYAIVDSWRRWMNLFAPHQLFTIGFSEPIEAFEWDPSVLPVDFVEVHSYNPLRVPSEFYWYGHYCGKPWMVGETALPADNDSIPYAYQSRFLAESFQCAVNNGACGYGWWEFQDCPQGVNFEAQYTGLLSHDGASQPKPAVQLVSQLNPHARTHAARPCNYYNMLGYGNFAIQGRIVDGDNQPVEGAVVRGWNKNWSIGMNTFSAPDGTFTLYSNDRCEHFEISAPGYTHTKFDRRPSYAPVPASLENQYLEYQSIDYRQYLLSDTSLLQFDSTRFAQAKSTAHFAPITLKPLKTR